MPAVKFPVSMEDTINRRRQSAHASGVCKHDEVGESVGMGLIEKQIVHSRSSADFVSPFCALVRAGSHPDVTPISDINWFKSQLNVQALIPGE